MILWNVTSEVYDWFLDYTQLDYILLCWVALLNVLITCINLVGLLQKLTTYAQLHVFIRMCS